MNSLTLTLKPKRNAPKKIVVEMDADKFERMAAYFGMLNPDFLKSVERAEQDYKRGQIYEVRSLEDLRS